MYNLYINSVVWIVPTLQRPVGVFSLSWKGGGKNLAYAINFQIPDLKEHLTAWWRWENSHTYILIGRRFWLNKMSSPRNLMSSSFFFYVFFRFTVFFFLTMLCFTLGNHASNCRQQLLCVYTHTQKLKPNPFSQSTSLVDSSIFFYVFFRFTVFFF